MYLKVLNDLVIDYGGSREYIYGGLDVNLIKGSCVDEENAQAVVVYESSDINSNVVEITEQDYITFRDTVSEREQAKTLTQEERMKSLEIENEQLKASQIEQDELIMELILGGM